MSMTRVIAVTFPAHALSQSEALAKLAAAGYSQIQDNGAGKIRTFRAVKNGKEVSVLLDSFGTNQRAAIAPSR